MTTRSRIPSCPSAPRRRFVQAAGAAVLVPAAGVLHAAEPWPARPVRLIIPYAAGGPTDLMARIVGKGLSEALGQPVVPENRLGAGGNVGTEAVARAQPDGYTIGMSAIASLAIAPALYRRLPFDVAKDFAPVALVGITQGAILAAPDAPFSDLAGLVAYAKASPGRLSYATPGIGTAPHLVAEYLSSLAGIRLEHVPYKGTTNAVQDLMSGVVPVSFESSLVTAVQNVRQGRLKAIAITTKQRSTLLPDVPTIAESGYPGFDVPTWFGIVAPAGTPEPVLDRLHDEIQKILATDDTRRRFADMGGAPAPMTRAAFADYIRSEGVRWATVARDAKIHVED